jgi:hypothetical protein
LFPIVVVFVELVEGKESQGEVEVLWSGLQESRKQRVEKEVEEGRQQNERKVEQGEVGVGGLKLGTQQKQDRGPWRTLFESGALIVDVAGRHVFLGDALVRSSAVQE